MRRLLLVTSHTTLSTVSGWYDQTVKRACHTSNGPSGRRCPTMDTVLGPKLSEHLLSSDTANTVLVSISSFQRCCRHRYVLDKTRRCALAACWLL